MERHHWVRLRREHDSAPSIHTFPIKATSTSLESEGYMAIGCHSRRYGARSKNRSALPDCLAWSPPADRTCSVDGVVLDEHIAHVNVSTCPGRLDSA